MKWTKETPDHKCLEKKTVIHGHVVTGSHLPEVHDNRIAIDTGANHTGCLTTVQIFAGGTGLSFLPTCVNGNGFISFRKIDPLDFRTGTVPAIRYEDVESETDSDADAAA